VSVLLAVGGSPHPTPPAVGNGCNGRQERIEDVLDLEGMVVRAMVRDKRLLVELFQVRNRR
jgi:hypothetical protein